MKKVLAVDLRGLTRMDIDMASAAAVPSSKREALAMGKAVRSVTMVW